MFITDKGRQNYTKLGLYEKIVVAYPEDPGATAKLKILSWIIDRYHYI